MCNLKIVISCLLLMSALWISANGQDIQNPEELCGMDSPSGFGTPATFRTGRLKPSRTDVGGAPSGVDYLPILIVFVQYAGQTGGNPNDPNDWVGGQAPNFINNIIKLDRSANSATWWDSYNGYMWSDLWHEYSRGKMHIRGQAVSIILPQTGAWYQANGGHAKINKDIYDILSSSPYSIDWPFYDKWTYNSDGSFTWGSDERVDMMVLAHRSDPLGLTDWAVGRAALGPCLGNNGQNVQEYTVYNQSGVVVKINAGNELTMIPEGSGARLTGRGGVVNKHLFMTIATHEMGHYLFGNGHTTYSMMAFGAGRELGLSPWEMVKLGYIDPKMINYANVNNVLYDYSSRNGYAGDQGEILQIPINTANTEFFLLANRRQVSEWDRRMAGDTLTDSGYEYLVNRNPEYGKGMYIYHIRGDYNWNDGNETRMDMECADGLWNWTQGGIGRPIWDQNTTHPAFIKTVPSYNDDSPTAFSCNNADDISMWCSGLNGSGQNITMGLWYSVGKTQQYNPRVWGTDRVYANEEDFFYSLENIGDRWDAWNVGYNEVFSPWSSPNTKNSSNQQTGIYIW
jgi:hypothetical protein